MNADRFYCAIGRSFLQPRPVVCNDTNTMRTIFIACFVATAIITGAVALLLNGVLPGKAFSVQAQTFSTGIKLALGSLPLIPSEKLGGEGYGAVNILLVGRAGPGWIAGDLADSIIILQLKPNTAALFISIPRDLFVEAPGTRIAMRINTLATLGEQEARRTGKQNEAETRTALLRQKSEEISGLSFPYVVLVDVEAVEEIVTALGGVQVDVAKKIHDPAFPTPGGGIETFTIDEGWRVIDGRTAGKYVRTRHDAEGDFGRMRRQQQVIEAALAKARGLKLVNDFGKILELIAISEEHVAYNFSTRELKRLWELTRDFETANLRFLALDRTDLNLLESKTVSLSGVAAPVLVPRAGMFEYEEIQMRIRCELEYANGCE